MTLRFWVVVASLLGFSVPSLADCRKVVRQAVVVEKVVAVVEPVIAATFVPVAVPQYSVGVNTGYVPPAQPSAEVNALKEEIERLRRDLLFFKQGQGLPPVPMPKADGQPQVSAAPAPAAAPAPTQHVAIFQAKCATCHEASVSKAKGKGLTLLHGALATALSAEQKLKVVKQAYAGSMPKGGPPLSDEETAKIVEGMTQ